MPRRQAQTRLPKPLSVGFGITGFYLFIMLAMFLESGGFQRGVSWPTITLLTIIVIGVWPAIIWWQRKQNAADKSLNDLKAMTPDVFEEWVAARFRDQGYSVDLTGAQGDHGVDLVGRRAGQTVVIQCKKYGNRKVGEPILRDLYGAMHDFGAAQAVLVTTGDLTDQARTWIVGKPIEVWDGDHLVGLSTKVTRTQPIPPKSSSSRASDPNLAPQSTSSVADRPTMEAAQVQIATCPKCGSALVQRTNRQSGEKFWGCVSFPKCWYKAA